MKKILLLAVLAFPLTLQAKYKFDETVFIPIEETGSWKVGKQTASEQGASLTRFVLESETESDWSKLITIQFKDRQLIQGKTAEEAMNQEQALSPLASIHVLKRLPNDVTYERTFPAGEHEIVRMVMTKKGLHRVACLKKGSFEHSEQKQWIECLTSGVVGR
ncbi:MAG: hypothetical protein S4CHLAM2_06880 [Chlamydiales bacterium]|nr:hypothetical protein [Chlamydiales bacterium]